VLKKIILQKTTIFWVVVFILSGIMIIRGFGLFGLNNKLSASAISLVGTQNRLVEEIPIVDKEESLNTQQTNPEDTSVFPQTIYFCETNNKQAKHTPLLINEVAWMGDRKNQKHEWVELKNISEKQVPLSNWQFFDLSKRTNTFLSGLISPGSFLLLTREGLGNVSSTQHFLGTLNNNQEKLFLFDNECNLIDSVSAEPSWPAGDNETKQTMERNSDLTWYTSSLVGGTPRGENTLEKITNNKLQITNNNQKNKNNLEPTADNTQQIIDNEKQNTIAKDYESTVYISEVMAGRSDNGNYEFIELFNDSDNQVDLTGWSIKKESSTGKETTLISKNYFEGKIIPPSEFLLLANEGGYTGDVSPDILWPKSYTLAYTKNALVLYDESSNKIERVYWEKILKDKSISRDSYNSTFITLEPSPRQ